LGGVSAKSSRSIHSSRESGRGRFPTRVLRVIGRLAFLFLPLRVVLDHELHRIEHGNAPRGDVVQVLAHAFLEHRVLDPGVGLGDADALGEQAEASGVKPRRRAPASVGMRGSSQPSTCFS